MPNLTQQQEAAFKALQHSHVEEFLKKSYAQLCEGLVTQRDAQILAIMQGKAQAFRELLGYIDTGFTNQRKA